MYLVQCMFACSYYFWYIVTVTITNVTAQCASSFVPCVFSLCCIRLRIACTSYKYINISWLYIKLHATVSHHVCPFPWPMVPHRCNPSSNQGLTLSVCWSRWHVNKEQSHMYHQSQLSQLKYFQPPGFTWWGPVLLFWIWRFNMWIQLEAAICFF
jgi:hypothetical protein